MSTGEVRDRLERIDNALDPRRARNEAVAQLDALFADGSAPDPPPHGVMRGRAIASTITPLVDSLGKRLSHIYMPWLGKKFDRAAEGGINVLTPSAVRPMRLLWPSYQPRFFSDRIEAFPFRTRIAAGAVDPDLQVLKIDYDFEDNPRFIIRRVLDELVRIDDGIYLGKVLLRANDRYRRIGFFTLET